MEGVVPNPDPRKVRDIGTRVGKQEPGLLEMNPPRYPGCCSRCGYRA
jgi:hypothetical protein